MLSTASGTVRKEPSFMNIRGPARARSFAEGTYCEALKLVQFHEATSNLWVWSNTAAAMAKGIVALAELVGE
jgi:hypothetical protein